MGSRKKTPYDDPFDRFIRDVMELLRRMDEDLSGFINGDLSWSSDYGGDEEGVGISPEVESSPEGGRGSLELEEQVVDVIELEDEILIVAEAPGVSKDEISVKIKGKEVTIKAGELLRRIQLPVEPDHERVRATYKNGILEVRVPKR
ncbi:MAG: Hsp20/alpha crystallin family protein [Candidatus Korarchaeum sp.]